MRPPCESCPGWFFCAWDQCCWGWLQHGATSIPTATVQTVCCVGTVSRGTARWTQEGEGRACTVDSLITSRPMWTGAAVCAWASHLPSFYFLGGRGQIGLFWGRRRFHPAALVLGGPEWFWSLRLTTGRGSLAGPPFEGDWIPEGLMFTVRGR